MDKIALVDKELCRQKESFDALLPNSEMFEKFRTRLKFALDTNQRLAKYDPKSLIMACRRAALDGLMPDGVEGALVPFGNSITWIPMVAGLRRLMSECGWTIQAEVVREKDGFHYELGDNPYIKHVPQPLGEKESKIVGAYAIARGPNGEVAREIMSRDELNRVKSCSRSGGDVYSSWEAEMTRKAPLRRLIKKIRLSDDRRNHIEAVIRREQDDFDPSLAILAEATPAQKMGLEETPPDVKMVEESKLKKALSHKEAMMDLMKKIHVDTEGKVVSKDVMRYLGRERWSEIDQSDIDQVKKLLESDIDLNNTINGGVVEDTGTLDDMLGDK